jgi:hypothetical protein
VREYLSPFPQLQVHKGDIVALLPSLTESAYRFVHIDTDLYQPTVACLDYFGARPVARRRDRRRRLRVAEMFPACRRPSSNTSNA